MRDLTLLAGDPQCSFLGAGNRDEGTLRSGIQAFPGSPRIGRMEYSAEVTDRPPFTVVDEAARVEVLAQLRCRCRYRSSEVRVRRRTRDQRYADGSFHERTPFMVSRGCRQRNTRGASNGSTS